MTKPATKKARAPGDWTWDVPAANQLDVTGPDGTVYPFYHNRIHHWLFDKARAARPDLLPEDMRFKDVAEVLAGVKKHVKAAAAPAKPKAERKPKAPFDPAEPRPVKPHASGAEKIAGQSVETPPATTPMPEGAVAPAEDPAATQDPPAETEAGPLLGIMEGGDA